MLSQLSHPSLPRLEVSCPPETFLTITRSVGALSGLCRDCLSVRGPEKRFWRSLKAIAMV